MARRPRIQIVTVKCKRGCGTELATLNRPIYSTQADYERYSGICSKCITEEEKADMNGAMLHRTAKNIIGG